MTWKDGEQFAED